MGPERRGGAEGLLLEGSQGVAEKGCAQSVGATWMCGGGAQRDALTILRASVGGVG